jgi:hypothetical protein
MPLAFYQESGFSDQRSGVRGQRAREQGSGVRDQGSGIRLRYKNVICFESYASLKDVFVKIYKVV